MSRGSQMFVPSYEAVEAGLVGDPDTGNEDWYSG